ISVVGPRHRRRCDVTNLRQRLGLCFGLRRAPAGEAHSGGGLQKSASGCCHLPVPSFGVVPADGCWRAYGRPRYRCKFNTSDLMARRDRKRLGPIRLGLIRWSRTHRPPGGRMSNASLVLTAAMALSLGAATDAAGELLSSRPITIVIPFTPGASADTLQR